jgi:hypothetical protein
VKAFILRNGFHANGDQTGSGLSGFTYRPFTLEGNFLAAQAVQEMLLQSWSPTPGQRDTEVLRLFPAVPWRWHEASFEDLRAEGGHRVSARRENNGTTWFRVVAGHDGVIRIRDNFEGRLPQWSRAGVRKVDGHFEVALKRGESIEARLDKPASIPDQPADAAEPLVIPPPGRIRANQLPLRIGANSDGGNRFRGDLAGVAVFNRPLSPPEISLLADPANLTRGGPPGQIVALDLEKPEGDLFPNPATPDLPAHAVGPVSVVEATDGLTGKVLHLDGQGFLEVPHDPRLDCLDGLTLAAWIRPHELPPEGVRIIDKSPVGAATAYLLDTYPGHSLRLIIRDPHLIHPANLPLDQWTHVAATVDGETGKAILYVNGQQVSQSP